jgi:hypothetical protein
MLATELDTALADDESGLQWLLSLLQDGVRLELLLSAPPHTSVNSASAHQRGLMRYLSPYLEDQRLSIHVLQGVEDQKPSAHPDAALPRIVAGANEGAQAWYAVETDAPLLNSILPTPTYRGQLGAAAALTLSDLMASALPLPRDAFLPPQMMQRWELTPGSPREPSDWFASVEGQHIEKLEIRDPYCGAGAKQLDALLRLIEFITGHAAAVSSIAIHTKELSFRDTKHQPPYRLRQQIEQAVRPLHKGKLQVAVSEFTKARNFHDRSIDVETVGDDGCTLTYRYDVTGGIDFLFDKRRETKLFCYLIDS